MSSIARTFGHTNRDHCAADAENVSPGAANTKPAADETGTRSGRSSRAAQGGFIEGLKHLSRASVAKAASKGSDWLRGPSLDLRDRDANAVMQSAPRSANFLAKVKTVRLPEGMTSVPPWMKNLPKLENLDARGFAGEKMALRAPKLAKVKVPPTTQVENRTGTNKKTLVKHVIAGQTVGTSTAIGQVYRSTAKAGNSDSLNGEVSFAGRRREKIWCRHIALREIFDAQIYDAQKAHGAAKTGLALRKFLDAKRPEAQTAQATASTSPTLRKLLDAEGPDAPKAQGTTRTGPTLRELLDAERLDEQKARGATTSGLAPRADVRHSLMGTRSRMKKHIDETIETRYVEIKQCSTHNYLLSHDRWGEFISQKFADMHKPGHVSLMLESGKHVMAMFLSAKPAKGNTSDADSMEYSVRFFDPNSMGEHVRVKEVDHTKFAALGIKDFIPDAETLSYYYGSDREFRTNGPVTCVAEIPGDAFLKQAHEPLFPPQGNRSVGLYLAREDISHAAVRKHLKSIDMPAYTALVEGAKAQPRDARAAFLRSMLAVFGRFELGDAVAELERSGDLDSSNARQLLADLEDSAPNLL